MLVVVLVGASFGACASSTTEGDRELATLQQRVKPTAGQASIEPAAASDSDASSAIDDDGSVSQIATDDAGSDAGTSTTFVCDGNTYCGYRATPGSWECYRDANVLVDTIKTLQNGVMGRTGKQWVAVDRYDTLGGLLWNGHPSFLALRTRLDPAGLNQLFLNIVALKKLTIVYSPDDTKAWDTQLDPARTGSMVSVVSGYQVDGTTPLTTKAGVLNYVFGFAAPTGVVNIAGEAGFEYARNLVDSRANVVAFYTQLGNRAQTTFLADPVAAKKLSQNNALASNATVMVDGNVIPCSGLKTSTNEFRGGVFPVAHANDVLGVCPYTGSYTQAADGTLTFSPAHYPVQGGPALPQAYRCAQNPISFVFHVPTYEPWSDNEAEVNAQVLIPLISTSWPVAPTATEAAEITDLVVNKGKSRDDAFNAVMTSPPPNALIDCVGASFDPNGPPHD